MWSHGEIGRIRALPATERAAPVSNRLAVRKSIRSGRSRLETGAPPRSIDLRGDLVSPVPIWRGERERIRQVPDLVHLPVEQQHLDNIKTEFHRRMSDQLQIVERRLRKQPSLAGVHRRRRTGPRLGRSRLHFDEDQTVALAEDEIDLPSGGSEIGREIFQSQMFQMFFCGGFTQLPSLQVNRSGLPPMLHDSGPEAHCRAR